MNRKLDNMGIAWSDFAYDVTMKGQADDEWKETIEQRIEDHTNHQLTDMEMRMTEQMAEMKRSHQQSQQKMQEEIDLLLERRGMDEESDY
jgi:tRNA C32,U32 (ribose-2'-O)-methylase TrmJ